MTRDKNYRKTPSKLVKIAKIVYKKYPKLVKAIENRYKDYNENVEYIYDLERKGKIFVIQPEVPLDLGRIEKNREKLEKVYQIGYDTAKKQYKNMMEYLMKK